MERETWRKKNRIEIILFVEYEFHFPPPFFPFTRINHPTFALDIFNVANGGEKFFSSRSYKRDRSILILPLEIQFLIVHAVSLSWRAYIHSGISITVIPKTFFCAREDRRCARNSAIEPNDDPRDDDDARWYSPFRHRIKGNSHSQSCKDFSFYPPPPSLIFPPSSHGGGGIPRRGRRDRSSWTMDIDIPVFRLKVIQN